MASGYFSTPYIGSTQRTASQGPLSPLGVVLSLVCLLFLLDDARASYRPVRKPKLNGSTVRVDPEAISFGSKIRAKKSVLHQLVLFSVIVWTVYKIKIFGYRSLKLRTILEAAKKCGSPEDLRYFNRCQRHVNIPRMGRGKPPVCPHQKNKGRNTC